MSDSRTYGSGALTVAAAAGFVAGAAAWGGGGALLAAPVLCGLVAFAVARVLVAGRRAADATPAKRRA